MMKHLLMKAAALAIIAACGSNTEQGRDSLASVTTEAGDTPDSQTVPEKTSPDSIPARLESDTSGPSPDIEIKIDQEMLTASASIDGRISDFSPALSERIKAEIDLAFEKAEAIAASDAEEGFTAPHDYQYEFEKSASVDDIISIDYFNMMFTGGAHPNYLLGGILHDRAEGEDISPTVILSEAGTADMKTLLMEKLAAAKAERMTMELEDMRGEVADVFPKEIEFWFGQVVLLPSTEAEKFGGLNVRFSPYDVGPYAEGSYDLLVTAAELDGKLSERFAPMFGGDPIVEDNED